MHETEAARPTIKDVALRAGVSVSTVSYRLSGQRPISSETADRIDAAMADLGFTPNSRARNLRRKRSDSVGLVLPDPQNPFFMQVAAGLESVLRPQGVCMVLCPTEFETERERFYAHLLTTRQLDGVVLLSGTGRILQALKGLASQQQVVLVDESLDGLDAPLVTADNFSGARALAVEAVARGHRDVAVIAGPLTLWTAQQRLAGMRAGLAEAGGRAPSYVQHAPYTVRGGEDVAWGLLSGPDRPSLVMAANDFQALGVMRVCRELGLEVGADVHVTGFDDIPVSSLVTPGLATVRQPAVEMGATAGRVLLAQLSGAAADLEERPVLATELVLRDSLGLGLGPEGVAEGHE